MDTTEPFIPINDLIDQGADSRDIPRPLAHALFTQESGKNPNARNGDAYGLGQLMPALRKDIDPFDPQQNISKSLDYLNEGKGKKGTWEGALKYYHGGPNESNWGPKTEAYVDQVFKHIPSEDQSQIKSTKEPFTPSTGETKEPFSLTSKEIKEPFTVPKEDSSIVKSLRVKYGDDFSDDLLRHADAIGLDVTDLAESLVKLPYHWGLQLGAQLAGASDEDAKKTAAKEVDSLPGVRKTLFPENQETSFIGDTANAIGQSISQSTRLASNPAAMAAGLTGDTELYNEARETPPKTVAGGMIEDTAQLAPAALLATKIQAMNNRLPSSRGLPNPNTPEPPTSPAGTNLAEQKTFTDQQNSASLAKYNENPQQYGVDTSQQVNPYSPGKPLPTEQEMRIDPEDGYHRLIDATTEVALQASYAVRSEATKQKFFKTNDPQVEMGYLQTILKNRDNGSFNDIVKYIANNSQDSFERKLGNALLDESNDAKYRMLNWSEENHQGAYATTWNKLNRPNVVESNVDLSLPNPDYTGIAPSTILHEGTHHRGFKLIELGSDEELSAKYPIAKAFVQDLREQWLGVMSALPEQTKLDFGKALLTTWENPNMSPLHEYLAWGLNTAPFQKILANTYISPTGETKYYPTELEKLQEFERLGTLGTSMWSKFGDTLLNGLGLGKYTTDAKREVLRNEILDFARFMNTANSALQELKDISIPFFEATKGLKPAQEDLNKLWAKTFENGPWRDIGTAIGMQAAKEGQYIPKIPKDVQEYLDKMVSPFDSYSDLVNNLGPSWYSSSKDLSKVTGIVYPVSMVPKIANNPIVTFTFTKIRNIQGDAHVLHKFLIEKVKPLLEDAPIKTQYDTLITLNEMNRPEIQEALALDRQQNNNSSLSLSDQELTHYGMSQKDIPLYRQTLEPMFQSLMKIDTKAIKKGFGRNFDSKVIGYFPRSFGYGKFTLTAYEPTSGAMKYYRRSKDWTEIRKLEEALRAEGLETTRKVEKDFTDFKGHLLALIEIDPKAPVSKIGAATIAAAEEHRRTQEFERSAKNVAGFIGQNKNDPKELELLKQSVYHRISQSIEAYKASRLLEEVLRPIQADPLAQHFFPNAVKWAHDIIRRELGGNVSELRAIDNMFQFGLEKAHTAYVKATTNLAKELKPNEQTITPSAAKELSRYASASGSAWVLMGNIPNLVTNAAAIPLVSLMGGLPDAILLKQNFPRAVALVTKAHILSVKDIAEVITGRISNPVLQEYWRRVVDRGLVMANAFADIPQMRSEIEKTKVRKAVDQVLTIPRKWFNDPVEIGTNIAALLFYRRLVEEMYPGMSKKQQFNHIVDLTKRYTGDYARYNKQLMFDKAGVLGQGFSNFSIWMGTRMAQSHELIKHAANKRALAPLVTIMATSIIVAGLAGAPLAQDYGNLQQFGVKHDLYHLPPLDLAMKQVKIPEWIRNGVILNKMNGAGVDLASRGKWNGFTDLGGVTYTLPGKIYDIEQYLQEYQAQYTGIGKGPTEQNAADFVAAVPTIAKGPLRQQLMSRHFKDGQTNIINRHSETSYTQKPEDLPANLLGFQTNKQAEEQRNYYNSLYLDRTYKKNITELKTHAMDQLVMMAEKLKTGDKGKAKLLEESARANLIKLMKANPSDFKVFSKGIIDHIQKETDTPKEKLLKELMHTKEGGRIKMLLESISVVDQK